MRIWLVLVRGDHELNEVKVGKVPGLNGGFRFATEAEILQHFGCKPGYLGPIGTLKPVTVVADRTVANMSDFVSGANEEDFHYTGVNWGRDLPNRSWLMSAAWLPAIHRPTAKGCSRFNAASKWACVSGCRIRNMNLRFTDEAGKSQTMLMGCYGIGVTRLLGAAIEQNHDDRGIVWPDAIAPFSVVVTPIGYGKSQQVRQVADQLYAQLQSSGIDVLLDDRDERPGVMFAEMELIEFRTGSRSAHALRKSSSIAARCRRRRFRLSKPLRSCARSAALMPTEVSRRRLLIAGGAAVAPC